jgi:hypothetical protein
MKVGWCKYANTTFLRRANAGRALRRPGGFVCSRQHSHARNHNTHSAVNAALA